MSDATPEPTMPAMPAEPVMPPAPAAAAAPNAAAPVSQRRGPGVFAVIVIAAITSLVVGTFAGLAGYLMGQGVDSSASTVVRLPQVSDTGTEATNPGASIASIAAAELPSVV